MGDLQWVIFMQKVERYIAVSKDKLGTHLKKMGSHDIILT